MIYGRGNKWTPDCDCGKKDEARAVMRALDDEPPCILISKCFLEDGMQYQWDYLGPEIEHMYVGNQSGRNVTLKIFRCGRIEVDD